MIQKHTEKILQDKEVIDKVICNCCGKPVHTAKDKCGDTMFIDYINFKQIIIKQSILYTEISIAFKRGVSSLKHHLLVAKVSVYKRAGG